VGRLLEEMRRIAYVQRQAVLITGAAEGVGRVIAEEFAKRGARLILVDYQEPGETLETIAKIGTNPVSAHYIPCDIRDEGTVVEMAKSVKSRFDGKVDILVNNAGFNGKAQLVEHMRLEDWTRTVSTNLTGTMLVTREIIPLLRAAGSAKIVNIASNVAKRGIAYRADYCCSKWALLGLTQTLALELAKDGIRVNAVCPGPIEGERVEQLLEMHSKAENRDLTEMKKDWMNVPLGRFIHPGEVASTVMFLAGEGSSAMTGQALNVTGGFIMD